MNPGKWLAYAADPATCSFLNGAGTDRKVEPGGLVDSVTLWRESLRLQAAYPERTFHCKRELVVGIRMQLIRSP